MDPAPQPAPTPAWRRYTVGFFGHFRRATRADYTVGVATPDERAFLSDGTRVRRVVEGPQAQDYLAWRRSGMAVAVVFLAVAAVVGTVRFVADAAGQEEVDYFDTGLATFLDFLLLGSKLVLFVACWIALAAWQDFRVSYGRLRLGWWIGFAIPFLVALVPLTSLFHFPATESAELLSQQQLTARVLGLLFAIIWFLRLMPSVLSILAGAIRASVAAKQFAPESAVPGWIAVVSAPVLCMLALVAFILVHQVGGNVLLALGFGLLSAGILTYTASARRIARPHSRAELTSVVFPVRRRATALSAVGLVLVLVAAFQIELLPGKPLLAFSGGMIGVLDLLELGLELYGRALFTTVLFADLIVRLLRHTWNEGEAFRLGELAAPLESKIRQLEAGGLAEVPTKPAAPASPAAS